MGRVAVDAMGSDGAPASELAGAVAALRHGPAELSVILVGDEPSLRARLVGMAGPHTARLSIRHAAKVLAPDESPARAARSGGDSSLGLAFELVARGEADAVVSAGNSGALLALGSLRLGRLPGVLRAAIAAVVPTPRGQTVLCDAGATVEPRPEALAQFALLGALLARELFARATPRVGLLANGREAHKGTPLVRAAHELLVRLAPDAGLDYRGLVEGHDLFGGGLDVMATDGFTGNALLKGAEGAIAASAALLDEELAASSPARLGKWLARGALARARTRASWVEAGGALLVGVAGTVVVCHGRSDARAMTGAILAADRTATAGVHHKIAVALARHREVLVEATSEPTSEPESETP